MRYIAFDIEAANGYKPYSICSIGIVVANEQLEVLHRENIWVNPKTKYNLNGTRQNVGIDLHLDKRLLDSSPDFAGVYDRVVELLTADDVVVIGHAVDSDVRMLNSACAKYKLPSIDYDFVCTQLLYKLYKQEKDVKALSKIATDIELQYNAHNSEDDAWMSLMTLAYVCKETNMTLDQLIDHYDIRKGSNKDFELTRCVSLSGQVSSKNVNKIALNKLRQTADSTKVVGSELNGITIALARSIEIINNDIALDIVRRVVAQGGKYTSKLNKCNMYVLPVKAVHQDNMRQRRVEELITTGSIETVSLEQILDKVGLQ